MTTDVSHGATTGSDATDAPPRAVPGDRADVYRSVRDSPAFESIRSSHRRFVVPACAVFLAWYLLYVLAAVAGGSALGRRVLGPLNVAMVLGLAQFASTFVIAWLYARNSSRLRDRAALNLRWDTQERVR